MPSKKELPFWVPTGLAATHHNTRPTELYHWVGRGSIRARLGKHNECLLHREDLLFCIDFHRRHQQMPPSLAERGLVRAELDGLSGVDVQKRLDNVDEDSGSDLDAPREVEFEEIVSDESTLVEVHTKVLDLQAQVRALTSLMTGGSKLPMLSEGQCYGLLQSVQDLLRHQNLPLKDIETWVKRLNRLSSEHFSMFAVWQQNFPPEFKELGLGDLPAYAPIVRLASKLVSDLEQRAGHDVAGTRIFSLRLRAERVREEIYSYAAAQSHLDAILEYKGCAELPVGHCDIDMFILDRHF